MNWLEELKEANTEFTKQSIIGDDESVDGHVQRYRKASAMFNIYLYPEVDRLIAIAGRAEWVAGESSMMLFCPICEACKDDGHQEHCYYSDSWSNV